MTIHVRAPATTANIGAGFDVAGAALSLWNEVVVRDGRSEPEDGHLGIRAFAVFASPAGRAFEWTSRIPRERGLGSSAAVVVLGLVAGALAAGVTPSVEEVFAAGLELEGHGDNLAPALLGGVCLTDGNAIHRIADDIPASPIAVVPEARVSTAESRNSLPTTVPRTDAIFSVGRAALLGAALASGAEQMFAASLDDRLHEPYRVGHAPHLRAIREDLPDGALGVTLSGSGPTVVVWAQRERATAVAAELRARYPDHTVLELGVTPFGVSPSIWS